MKVGIIGGGISGLSAARMLSERHTVCLFERDSRPGGLVKCDVVNGVLYHKVGGHVFNSRRRDVLDWFWGHFDRERDFTQAVRNAVIALSDGTIVNYPIENHLYQLPEKMQTAVVNDLLDIASAGYGNTTNFDDFLKSRFGNMLYQCYFAPYNAKIWRRPLTDVPLSWLHGKLPMPTVQEILLTNISKQEERSMVHSTFHYARSGGSQFLADSLAADLDIRYNADVRSIRKTEDGWEVMGECFDIIIFAGNVKELPSILKDSVDLTNETPAIAALESHGTTSVLCETDANPYSWIYMPDPAHSSHRIICTGNFSPHNAPQGMATATIEFSEPLERTQIEAELAKMPFHPRYIAHHWEEYTYPVQTEATRPSINALKSKLAPLGIYLLGRFAEWEYYNMDAAIGAALDLTATLP